MTNSERLSKKGWHRYLKNFNPQTYTVLLARKAAKSLILTYKWASFLQKGSCRHYPTCSHYALECFEKFHPLKALCFSLKRIVSCRPLSKKPFYDPVP